jgi:hypothetical protein
MNICTNNSTSKQGLSATKQATQESEHSQKNFSVKQLCFWNPPQSLELFRQQKPQISSIPGISPKQRDRYQVLIGDVVLGAHLSLDDALKLAQGAS